MHSFDYLRFAVALSFTPDMGSYGHWPLNACLTLYIFCSLRYKPKVSSSSHNTMMSPDTDKMAFLLGKPQMSFKDVSMSPPLGKPSLVAALLGHPRLSSLPAPRDPSL